MLYTEINDDSLDYDVSLFLCPVFAFLCCPEDLILISTSVGLQKCPLAYCHTLCQLRFFCLEGFLYFSSGKVLQEVLRYIGSIIIDTVTGE